MPIIIMIIMGVYFNCRSQAITYGLSLSLYLHNKLHFKIKNNTAQITWALNWKIQKFGRSLRSSFCQCSHLKHYKCVYIYIYAFSMFFLSFRRLVEEQSWELLHWVCLMLAGINWYHMVWWQDHSIFCVPEHHINHFFFGGGGYSFPFITQEFPNSPCLYFSHTCSAFTYTSYTLPLLGARLFDQVQAGAKQNVKVRCQVRLPSCLTCWLTFILTWSEARGMFHISSLW